MDPLNSTERIALWWIWGIGFLIGWVTGALYLMGALGVPSGH
jgi:hypothetical protein